MAIKRKLSSKVFTKEHFLKEVKKESKKFMAIQDVFNAKVQKLADAYIKENSKYQVGSTIKFQNPTNGFHLFKIEKIQPEINWEKNSVRFLALGEFRGFEKKEEKGAIYLDELKPVEM